MITCPTLGKYFTMDVAARSTQPVVQAGPYRFVRHPSYTAILVMLLGVGMALAKWASSIIMLASGLIGLLYRVRVGERALGEAPGQPYVDYMRHTWRFIALHPVRFLSVRPHIAALVAAHVVALATQTYA